MIPLATNLVILALVIGVQSQPAFANDQSILVVVISGFRSDASPDQIARRAKRGAGNSGVYQLMVDLERSGCVTEFFNWNGTSAGQFAKQKGPGSEVIASFIRRVSVKPGFDQLVLVGHSWGGHTMLEVAKLLGHAPTIKIHLAVGLDASSFSREERTNRLPSNIEVLVNYYSNNVFCWGEWNDGNRIKNISLAKPENGFVIDGEPDYASQISLRAHNAVEWDGKLHQHIVKRVQSMAAERMKANQGVNTEASDLSFCNQ